MPRVSDEVAALKLYEFVRDERSRMVEAVKRIDSLFQGEEISGTNFNKEFADFLGHLGNIKGHMTELNQAKADSDVTMIRLYRKTGLSILSKEEIRWRLDHILTLPIDTKSKLWKKISAQVMSHGFGAGASVER